MADPITIEIEIAEPVALSIDEVQVNYIGTAQAGPQGIPGDANFWMEDAETTIKPVSNKTVDANNISGTMYGGLFQP